jgi:hypothetical protein
VPLCDGKVSIFKNGEEKLLPGCPKWQPNTCDVAENRYSVVSRHQTIYTCVRADAAQAAKQWAKNGLWPVRRAGAVSLRQWYRNPAQPTKHALGVSVCVLPV